jgi:hypothetical protein
MALGYPVSRRLRAWWWLRKPRCGALPPWRLIDAGPCCRPAGHHRWKAKHDPEWCADGNGFIWTATEWRWMGPVIDLADVLQDHPARTLNGFEEWIG